jgi:hypothetical protein
MFGIAHILPTLGEFADSLHFMVIAQVGIPQDHIQGLPAAEFLNGDKGRTDHNKMACPMVAPIVDPEVCNPCPLTGRLVRLGDGVAAGEFIIAGIGVRLAEAVQEDVPG